MASVACYFERLCPPDCRQPGCSASLPPVNPSLSFWFRRLQPVCSSATFSSTYAFALASSTDRPTVDSDGFMLVGGRRSSPARKTIRGKKTVTHNCKLRPMPRRLTAFVGRLYFDTSADDLLEFLEAAGVINPTCKRFEAKNGRQFKTAAFMVSCDAGSKDIFYDESIWLEGCELRD